ncbi:MAG: hypothetical protein U9N45_04750 [Gemmatimonadota bacterium]|nr:hypothetical protein [Gemmatimonadota bacterium]
MFLAAKIILILLAGLFLFWFIRANNRRLNRESRAATFKVGGSPSHEKQLRKETREERQQRGKVSLRDGPRFKRRFR